MKWLCGLFVVLLLSGCGRAEVTIVTVREAGAVPVMTVQPTVEPTPQPTVCPTVQPEATVQPAYVGRFSVAAVGVDVACYAGTAQATVDAADSAALFAYGGHTVIGDHVNQGFGALKQCTAGDTAQLTTADGVEHYQCVAVISGHNTGYDLTDESYNSIAALYPDTLVCYTCNDGWQNVTLIFFAPIEDVQAQPIAPPQSCTDECQ